MTHCQLGIYSGFANLPRFAGDQERREYYAWLSTMPERSLAKIRAINRAGKSKTFPPRVSHNVKHILMALKASLFDPFVRQVTREIITLRQGMYRIKWATQQYQQECRQNAIPHQVQAERQEVLKDEHLSWEERLQDFHIAIDWATGTVPTFQIPEERKPLIEDVRKSRLHAKESPHIETPMDVSV